MSKDLQDDFCHEHGGWGSTTKPCKVCGVLREKSDMPEIPKGLSWVEALRWGAEQINKQINKHCDLPQTSPKHPVAGSISLRNRGGVVVNTDMKTFGDNLRKARLAKQWGQRELSNKCGIPMPQISNFECGQREPSLKNLRKLRKALGCGWGDLLD